MQYLEIALKRVKNLRQPPTGFMSGHIVYEPDRADRTPEAEFKRRIFAMAYLAEGIAHSILAGQTPVAVTPGFDVSVFEDIPEKLTAEAEEFFAFASAIETLLAEIERAGGIEVRPRAPRR